MFRILSKKYFEPVSMWLMILGLVSIVQPWSMFFHLYGVVITLAGLVSFIFFSHIKPLPEEELPDVIYDISCTRAEPVSEGEETKSLRRQGDKESGITKEREKVLSGALEETE